MKLKHRIHTDKRKWIYAQWDSHSAIHTRTHAQPENRMPSAANGWQRHKNYNSSRRPRNVTLINSMEWIRDFLADVSTLHSQINATGTQITAKMAHQADRHDTNLRSLITASLTELLCTGHLA